MLRNKERKGPGARPGPVAIRERAARLYRFGATVLPSPMTRIVATPHRMMPAHEVDAMAAIARADVDGFNMRGQRCNDRIGGNASCGRLFRRR